MHELKCWPEPFRALWDNRKTYELRRNDRGFRVGDLLLIREWSPETGTYTGRDTLREITYITPGGSWGLPPDLCVLGVSRG